MKPKAPVMGLSINVLPLLTVRMVFRVMAKVLVAVPKSKSLPAPMVKLPLTVTALRSVRKPDPPAVMVVTCAP